MIFVICYDVIRVGMNTNTCTLSMKRKGNRKTARGMKLRER